MKIDASTPSQKKVIYRKIKGYQGICTIWDYCPKAEKYKQRTKGLRFYTYKKMNGKQKGKSFETFEESKKWRSSFEPWKANEYEEIDLLFSEVFEKYFTFKKPTLRASTLDTYESKARHLKYFYDFKMSSITPRLIDQWIASIKEESY